MGLFYDPLQKRTKPWVFILFVILPMILIGLLLIVGGQYSKKKSVKDNEKDLTPKEFFQKFEATTK